MKFLSDIATIAIRLGEIIKLLDSICWKLNRMEESLKKISNCVRDDHSNGKYPPESILKTNHQ